MTDPLPLASGAVVQVTVPSPPIITSASSTFTQVVVPVPGPPGPPGSGTAVIGEVPSGTKDGVNAVFTLAHTPPPGTTAVYRNGLREVLGVGYTVSGPSITFSNPPLTSDDIAVDYFLEG